MAGGAVCSLAWGWISDDSEGSSAAPKLFADLKISAAVVMNQDSDYCTLSRAQTESHRSLKVRIKSEQLRAPKCQVGTGHSWASPTKIVRWMLGMGFLLPASVSFRPWEGEGGIKNVKPLFEPSEVDKE